MHLEQPVGKSLRQVSVEDSRRNRVHLYPKSARFTGETFCEPNHRGFGSCVVNGCRQCAQSPNGSDVKNASLPLADHLLVDWFGYSKETIDIGVNHFIPGAVGSSGKVVSAVYSSVVYQYIYPAPLLNQLPRDTLHTQAISNGNHRAKRPPAVGFDLPANLFSKVDTFIVAECDVGAFASKYLAKRCSDAARSPCDERSLSLKQQTHSLCCLLKIHWSD